MLCHMCGDKRGSWMSRENTIALTPKFFFAEVRWIKTPLRMRRQLHVAFVVLVDWLEERIRIRDIEHDRDAQVSCVLEHGRDTLVVNPQQAAVRITQTCSQVPREH